MENSKLLLSILLIIALAVVFVLSLFTSAVASEPTLKKSTVFKPQRTMTPLGQPISPRMKRAIFTAYRQTLKKRAVSKVTTTELRKQLKAESAPLMGFIDGHWAYLVDMAPVFRNPSVSGRLKNKLKPNQNAIDIVNKGIEPGNLLGILYIPDHLVDHLGLKDPDYLGNMVDEIQEMLDELAESAKTGFGAGGGRGSTQEAGIFGWLVGVFLGGFIYDQTTNWWENRDKGWGDDFDGDGNPNFSDEDDDNDGDPDGTDPDPFNPDVKSSEDESDSESSSSEGESSSSGVIDPCIANPGCAEIKVSHFSVVNNVKELSGPSATQLWGSVRLGYFYTMNAETKNIKYVGEIKRGVPMSFVFEDM